MWDIAGLQTTHAYLQFILEACSALRPTFSFINKPKSWSYLHSKIFVVLFFIINKKAIKNYCYKKKQKKILWHNKFMSVLFYNLISKNNMEFTLTYTKRIYRHFRPDIRMMSNLILYFWVYTDTTKKINC